jgi:hydroxyacylglutathione hydrolase
VALEVVMMTLGIAQTNCYILGDTETKAAVVIDPSDNAAAIMQQITDRGWQVKQILGTHAHFDHVLAVDGVRQATGAPFRLHEADLPTLAWMQASGQRFGLEIPPPPEVDSYVEAGETITVDGIQLEVLFTPGHALGHVSYVLASDSMVFSGDCLFRGSIGRTDLPGCDHDTLMRSIFEVLLPLGDEYTVLPGHGPMTSIAEERQLNPFLVNYTGA